MTKIVISYRRSDSDSFAGRVRDKIAGRFGNDAVYMDIDNIPFGRDFREHIKDALHQCDVVVVIIGNKWLGSGKSGQSRINDETDPVRVEVEAAIREGIPILPILVGNTRMPKPDQLPRSLEKLAYINAASVDTGRDFHPHTERVLRSIDDILKSKAPTPAPSWPDSASTPAVATATVVKRESNSVTGPAEVSTKTVAGSGAGSSAKRLGSLFARPAAVLFASILVAGAGVGWYLLNRSAPIVAEVPHRAGPQLMASAGPTTDVRPERPVGNPIPRAAAAFPALDCTRAYFVVEQAVCGNADLVLKDKLLADILAFLQDRVPANAREEFIKAQQQWLRTRDQCAGADITACLSRTYDARIVEFKVKSNVDCVNDRRPVEQAICGNVLLSIKDRKMADTFGLVKKKASQEVWQQVFTRQGEWLKVRNECRGPEVVACANKHYDERIQELEKLVADL